MRMQVVRWALLILLLLRGEAGAFQLHRLQDSLVVPASRKEEGGRTNLSSCSGQLREGLVKDMINAACLSAVGDVSAQVLESIAARKPLAVDLGRARRYLFFGLLDGAVAHTWYYGADKLIRGNSASSILLKIAADSLVSACP